MGVVYRARNLRLDRVVALKVVPPNARSEREWRLLAALDHPNVIPIYEAGEEDGKAYLSMRWVSGGDLAARLRGTAGPQPRPAPANPPPGPAPLGPAPEPGPGPPDLQPPHLPPRG